VSKVGVAIAISIVLAGCGRRTAVPVARTLATDTVSTVSIPEHQLIFQQGLAAFREFTPEGYARAAGLFRRASDLAAGNCDYRLHLAQANLFLAFEQASNLEDFSSSFGQSVPPACGAGTAFALRLEAFRSLAMFRLGVDRVESSRQINSAIELDPANGLNWSVLWELSLNVDREANPITRAADEPADLAIIYYYRGRYWFLRADFARARKSFERAIELSPRHFRSYIGVAESISAVDPDENVEAYYKRAVEIAPNNLIARIELGNYYVWVAETGLAEEQYLAAVKSNPRYVPGYLGLGQNYLNAGFLDQAEQALRTAIEIAPTVYEAYYYLGNVWLARDDLDRARQQYQAALDLVPVYPEALYALGTVLAEKREFDLALERFEGVLKVSPTHPGAYFWRAVIRADRKEYAGAIADCNQAIRLYDMQSAVLAKSIANAERHGHARRAAAEQRKKSQLDETTARARELKSKIEKSL
jgi:tetratricopeptide (TPR) repeat protein